MASPLTSLWRKARETSAAPKTEVIVGRQRWNSPRFRCSLTSTISIPVRPRPVVMRSMEMITRTSLPCLCRPFRCNKQPAAIATPLLLSLFQKLPSFFCPLLPAAGIIQQMPDAQDMDLVREFVRDNSDAAFAELVRRHYIHDLIQPRWG